LAKRSVRELGSAVIDHLIKRLPATLTPRFPKRLYETIPALYPHMVHIFNSCKVSGPEFLVLSYVKNAGKVTESGEVALPISQLTQVLVDSGLYDSRSGAAGFIQAQQDKKKYLRQTRITHEQKRLMFPDSTGYRDVVILTEEGRNLVEQVNKSVEALFGQVAKRVIRQGKVPASRFAIAALAIQATASDIKLALDELHRDYRVARGRQDAQKKP